MIIFNEGLPGAGKTYDVVRTHIVPALKEGRKVFARVNGLNNEAIAAHLEVPQATIDELLVHVAQDDVIKLAETVEQNSLVVIDECHEFYVASRDPLPDEQERFFAMHRHEGLDIILISQFYKRVHSAVRARVEAKNLFRKLNMLGMNNRYAVEFFAAVSPDKFDKTGSETRRYDPAIFALYQSVAPGTTNLNVYSQGRKKVWEGKAGWYAVAMVCAAVAGGWYFFNFFTGNSGQQLGGIPKEAGVNVGALPVTAKRAPVPRATGAGATTSKPVEPTDPETQYILNMAAQGRARVGALAMRHDNGRWFGLVEFVESGGRVVERLDLQELRGLGWRPRIKAYGVRLEKGDHVIIATRWPRDWGTRYTERDRHNIRESAHPTARVSAQRRALTSADIISSNTSGAGSGRPAIATYDPALIQ